MFETIISFFTPEIVAQIVKAIIGLAVFFLIYLVLRRLAKKLFSIN